MSKIRRRRVAAALQVVALTLSGIAVTSAQPVAALPTAVQADSIPDVRMVCGPGQTNINHADAAALSGALQVPGPVAARVVAARPFLGPRDLAVVEGIGPDKLSAILAAGRTCATPTQLPPRSDEACTDGRPDLQTATVDEMVDRLRLARPAAQRLAEARPFAVKRHLVPERVPGVGKGTLDSLIARTCLTPAPVATDRANYRWVYRDLGGRVVRESFALKVPVGVLGSFGAWASITDASAPSALTGPTADFHIWAPWGDGQTKPVLVTLPIDPALSLAEASTLTPAAVHFTPGNDPDLYGAGAAHVDAAAKTITVATTSLSLLQATWLPTRWFTTADPLSLSRTILQTVLEFSGVGASQPDCNLDITADNLVATHGSMFDVRLVTGQPRFRYCVERDTASAVWKLANNTGAAMRVYGIGDPEVIDVSSSNHFLTDAFFAVKNGGGPYDGGAWVPPGSTVLVRVPQGRVAQSVQADVDSPVNASAYLLRQLDLLLPEKSMAAQVYSFLTRCGYSVGMSHGGLPEVLGCAALLAETVSPAAKKALNSTAFVVGTGTYLADSLRGILEGGFNAYLTYRYPAAPPPGDGGSGGAGPDGSIVGAGKTTDLLWRLRSGADGNSRGQAYLVLPGHVAVSTVDAETISCLNRRYVLRDFATTIPWAQESGYAVKCDDTQPAIDLPVNARNWVLRMSNGAAWFVNSQGQLENILSGGTYIACVQHYYVLDDYPAELVDRFGDRATAPPATCG